MNKLLLKLTTLCLCVFLPIYQSAFALESDRDQPVEITADSVEYNFATGERIYNGNVVLTQGTLEVKSNRLVALFEGDVLDKATATGSADKRARFKQRPDGKDDDVIGIGDKLIYDETNQEMRIVGNAELMQANQKANGNEIVYDINAENMKVKSGGVIHDKKKSEELTDNNISQQGGRSKLVITPDERATNNNVGTNMLNTFNAAGGLEAVGDNINGANSRQLEALSGTSINNGKRRNLTPLPTASARKANGTSQNSSNNTNNSIQATEQPQAEENNQNNSELAPVDEYKL